ncbi:MAG: competence protein ComEC family protein [Prevotellaceae bacterium]|nr:competence protein ComEC family protein [Prevotellaceae bacterium]
MKYTLSFIEYIRRLPFVRLLAPFLCGIVAEELIFQQRFDCSLPLFVSLFLFVLMFFVRLGKSYQYRWLWGVLIFCSLFLFGSGIMQNRSHRTELLLDRQSFFSGIIVEKPAVDLRFTKLTLQVKTYRDSLENWIGVSEKTFVYIPTDSLSNTLNIGDVLLLNTVFKANQPPDNPEEFDYAYYLARRKFFATSFTPANGYKKIRNEHLWFKKAILNIETAMFDCLKKVDIEGDNFAVLRALIIGDKQQLSDKIISAYSVAGAMHVLAVSGLHVGLVYAVLVFLLSPVKKRRFGKIAGTILIFFGIWVYAALAAFSPSVCRACVMFSFVLSGSLFGKKVNIYNSLAASAFFLSIINPYNIFEVGFQLSYCSVIAIVYFQPLLNRMLYIRNKILKHIYALATVSLAAQIGTSGITIFYFHTFPNYFLITNILIIPLVTVIMFTVAATFMLSWIPVAGILIGKFLNICVSIANHITQSVEMLPYSLINNIYINELQVWTIIVAFILLAFYIEFGNKKNLIAILLCFTVFCSVRSLRRAELENQHQMIVYSAKGSTFISFVAGQNSVNIRDYENSNNTFDFNTQNSFIKLGIKKSKTLLISDDFKKSDIIKSYRNIILFNKKSIKIATENDIVQSQKPLDIDILVVNKYLGNNIQKLLNIYHPQMLIIDSSVPLWQARRWIAEAENRNINHHCVTDKGAFVFTE